MNPIFGSDVYRNRYYGASNAGAQIENAPSDAGMGTGIFGQRRQQQNQPGGTGGIFAPPTARPSGTGTASNMTGAPTTGSNMTGAPPAPDAPAFGANVNRNPSGIFTSPQPSASAPPGTPPPAPTAAQVGANPGDYAGTSFDPNLSAQFRPPTGLANSTTADSRDSNGEVIRGFRPYQANPARGADPSTIPGFIMPGTTPGGIDPTTTQLGTQRQNQTLIYGPYQGTWGYRWVNNDAVNSGQAFVDAVAPEFRSNLQVTPEWIAQQRRFYGVR